MRIINASVEIMDNLTRKHAIEIMKKIERAGRTCYKSECKITNESYVEFIRNIIKRGHVSILEHGSVTVKFVCDRLVSHQIVRHRLSSYSQESTRYCNYSQDKFDKEITVIRRFCDEVDNVGQKLLWETAVENAEKAYFELLAQGDSPEFARCVLPQSLKTELIVTSNLRNWIHILYQRIQPDVSPATSDLMRKLLMLFQAVMPEIFETINIRTTQ